MLQILSMLFDLVCKDIINSAQSFLDISLKVLLTLSSNLSLQCLHPMSFLEYDEQNDSLYVQPLSIVLVLTDNENLDLCEVLCLVLPSVLQTF